MKSSSSHAFTRSSRSTSSNGFAIGAKADSIEKNFNKLIRKGVQQAVQNEQAVVRKHLLKIGERELASSVIVRYNQATESFVYDIKNNPTAIKIEFGDMDTPAKGIVRAFLSTRETEIKNKISNYIAKQFDL